MIIYSHYFNAFKSSIRHPFLFTARSQGDPYSDALSGDSRDFTSASKSFFPVVEERLRNVAAYKPAFYSIPEVEAVNTRQISSPFLWVQFNFGEVEINAV
jgi:hypothetical protein